MNEINAKENFQAVANIAAKAMTERTVYDINPELVMKTYEAAIEALAMYLGKVKSTVEGSVGIALRELVTGNFIIGAIVETIESEDGKSFAISYTLDESVLDNCTSLEKSSDRNLAFDDIFMHCLLQRNLKYIITKRCVDSEIEGWRDKSSKEKQTLQYANDFKGTVSSFMNDAIIATCEKNVGAEIEIPNIANFKSVLVDGDVKISVTPFEVLKQHVKDDTIA